ncbi:MAG: hypothetical protein FRX49_09275 [Trebouxia sp. A1-2]|nr:MAG: hypothetical protein FRX49_09275 [Trebouxia sp. A1-2]
MQSSCGAHQDDVLTSCDTGVLEQTTSTSETKLIQTKQLSFCVANRSTQGNTRTSIISKDAKLLYFLSDRGKLSFAHRIDWCLSSNANQASADAICVTQGMFDRSAVFESSKGHHLMTMHQFLGASNILTWRSRTYRRTKPFSAEQLRWVQDCDQQQSTRIERPLVGSYHYCKWLGGGKAAEKEARKASTTQRL